MNDKIEALADMILLVIRKTEGTLTDAEVIKRALTHVKPTYTATERAKAWDLAIAREMQEA